METTAIPKRVRTVASIGREDSPVVRLGGGWDGRFARLGAVDRYRAQVSRFGKAAELTRLAFILEALPATRAKTIVFVARTDRPVPLAWQDKLRTIAGRLGMSSEYEVIAGNGLRLLTVRNEGGKVRREPSEYDRILAKRDERFARKRAKSGRNHAAEARAEMDYWDDEQAKEQAREALQDS